MRILVDESLWGAKDAFAVCGVVQTFDGRSLRREDLADAEVLIVRSVTPVDAGLLEGSRVRFVGTATTGTDHVDVDWLESHGIAFASAAGCNARPVAEYVITAILLLASEYGFDPTGKTLGVVGVGRVGSRVARWAGDMGIRVLPHDPPLQRRTGSGEYVSLETLAAEADLVTLHVPLTRTGEFATASMADEPWLRAMKTGVFLINTSRGEVVEESALMSALQDGHVTAAVLDVWRNEPCIDEGLLQKVAIATPHIAGYSLEAKMRATQMIRDALSAWTKGSQPLAGSDEGRGAPCEAPPPTLVDTVALDVESPDRAWWQLCRTALTHACDLPSMDARLRRLQQEGTLASGFDPLRRVFATRREFDAYGTRGCPPGSRAGCFLGNLGFRTGE